MPVQLSGSLLMSGSITATGLISAQGGISSVGAQQITDLSNPISFTSTASLYTDGGIRVTKDMFVSGTAYFNNVTIYGTQSVEYITSSQLNIGTNIITVNTDTPTVRYGGLAVYDSGSTGLTGSLLWDSEANHWIYTNPSGSTYSGGMMISGPRASARGCEQGTTSCALMVGQGGDHITSSAVFHYGNATCFYGNATIQSSGATCLASTLSATKGTFTGTGYVLDLNRTDNTALIQLQYNGTVGSLLGTTGANNLTVYNASAAPMLNLTSGIGCFSGAVCAPAFVGGTVNGTTGTFSSNAASLTFGANDTVEKYMTIRFSNGDFFVGGTSVQNYIYGAGSRNLALWTNSTQRFLIDGNGVSCFACQTCTPALDIMPSGIGVSTLGGIMRVVTGGTAVGIGVGQSNTNRYTQISANDLLVYNDDFFIATRCAFPLSIGTCYTSRLTFAATGIACFACRVCAPVITAGAGTSSQAIKITGDDNYIEFDNAGTYIKGGGNLTAAATSTFLLSTSANTRLTIAPAGEAVFACQVCMPKLIVENGAGQASIFRQTDASSYSSLRLYNDQNSATRALEIDYFGSTYSTGERAEIFSTGAYPLLFGTSNVCRVSISSTGITSFACQICSAGLHVGGCTILGGTGNSQENPTRLGGTSVYNGVACYGSYGKLLFNANTNLTGGAYRYLLTNALDGNKFGFIRSPDANTDPSLGLSGAISSGSATMVFDGGNVGIGSTSPISTLTVRCDVSSQCFTGIIVENFAGAGSECARAGIAFKGYDWVQGGIWHGRNGGNFGGALVFGTNPDTTNLTVGGLCTRLVFTNAGIATFSCQICAAGLRSSANVTINKSLEGLTVSGGSSGDATYMSFQANSQCGWLIVGAQGSVANYIQTGTAACESAITTVGAFALGLGTNQIERMRITSTGISCFACTVCASNFFTTAGGTVSACRFYTATQDVAVNNGVFTDIFCSYGNGGVWLVSFTLNGNPGQIGYAIVGNAFGNAITLLAGATGAQTCITTSGLKLQVCQTSGANLTARVSSMLLTNIIA